MKIKRLFSCMVAIAVLVAIPASAQDRNNSLEEKKPPATKKKRTRHLTERDVVRTFREYKDPDAGASCNISCANGTGGITCRVGEACACSCSGNYPNCSCD